MRLEHGPQGGEVGVPHDQEERRGARFDRLLHFLDELLVDPEAGHLPEPSASQGADQDPSNREKQPDEQQTDESASDGANSDSPIDLTFRVDLPVSVS